MIAVLSPAKTLDYLKPLPDVVPTRPRFDTEAVALAAAAAKLGARRLAKLMDISDALATLNAGRFAGFEAQPERPALFAFAGDVYLGFEARSLDAEAIGYAQGHVRMVSGLYGLLRPLDAMRPYRLEMGTKWSPRRGADLYRFWGSRIADALAADVAEEGSGVILNLASREYWGAVAGRLTPDIRAIAIDFREIGPNGERFNSFAAKRARGMMARWLCEHRVAEPEGLEAFDSDGYRFTGADGDTWKFLRS